MQRLGPIWVSVRVVVRVSARVGFGVRVRIKNKVLLNGVFFKKVGNKVDGIILIGKKVLKRPMVQVPFIKLGKFCRCLFDGDYLLFRVFSGK